MSFKDLDDWFDDSLRLPIGGKTYVIPSPPAKTGLRVQRLMQLGTKAARLAQKQDRLAAKEAAGETVTSIDRIAEADELTDAELAQMQMDDQAEEAYYASLLGPAYDEMIADGVALHRLKHAAVTASVWISGGMDAAEQFWATGGRPPEETPEPNREARRSASKAAGSTTRPRASSSGTRTPPKT